MQIQLKNNYERNISDCLSPCGFSTKSKGIKALNSENVSEYDKLFQNRNKISKVARGSSMKQEDCKRLELSQNGIQVILEFPKETKNEENIKREVKEILSGILQEHLTEIF